MAYSNDIREQAFAVFCRVTSHEETAQVMRERFPEECGAITKTTVFRWKKKYDWEGREAKIMAQVAAENDGNLISDRKRMLGEMRTLRKRLVRQLEKAEVKSMEGGVSAYGNICKWIMQFSGHGEEKRAVDDVVMVLFEVLGEHPKIAPLIHENEVFLLGEIKKRLERPE